MKRLFFTAAFLAAAAASASDYTLDTAQSDVHLSVPLMAVSKVTGKFMRYSVQLDAGRAKDLSQGSVTAVIQMASHFGEREVTREARSAKRHRASS